MPEYSGVAAVLPQPGPAHEPPAGEQMMAMMERIVAVKNAQQTAAASKLESMMKMVGQGFPVDPKAATKLIKQSGLPISTKPDDMMVDVAVDRQMKQGTHPTADASPGGAQGGQAQNVSAVKGAQDQQKQQQQSPLPPDANPQQKKEFFLNTIAKQARKSMELKNATEQQTAENNLHVEQLKDQALRGDDKAMGTLIRMGFGKFDIGYEQWSKMTPEQKNQAVDIAAGAESPAEKGKRVQTVADTLISSGRMTDPGAAFQAAGELVSTGKLSADTQGKVKPFSFDDIAKQTEIARNMQEMGYPSDKIGPALAVASVAGLQNAIPSGLKSNTMKQLELQQSQVALEGQRVGIESKMKDIEVERYKGETARLQKLDEMEKNKQLGEEGKQTLDMFRAALEAKKSGTPFPKDIMRGLFDKVANLANMEGHEVEHWYGNTYEFAPRLSEGGKSTVDQAAGAPLNTPSGNAVSDIYKAGKKAISGGVRDVIRYGQQQDEENAERKGPI